jgi:hypothetical protein
VLPSADDFFAGNAFPAKISGARWRHFVVAPVCNDMNKLFKCIVKFAA